jgi:hypothetical protein
LRFSYPVQAALEATLIASQPGRLIAFRSKSFNPPDAHGIARRKCLEQSLVEMIACRRAASAVDTVLYHLTVGEAPSAPSA